MTTPLRESVKETFRRKDKQMKLQNIAWSLFSSISIKRNTFFTLQHCEPPSCSFAQLSMCSTPNLQEQRGTAPNQLRLECQHSHKFTNLEKEETKLFSPPSPFPALMVNHSSLAFAWFVAWWEWKSQHNQLFFILLYFSPNEILTKVGSLPGSPMGGRRWRHPEGVGRVCSRETSLQSMASGDFLAAER